MWQISGAGGTTAVVGESTRATLADDGPAVSSVATSFTI